MKTAARLFSAKGFSGTSTHAIANELGVQSPEIFSHFKSKDELLEELYEVLVAPALDFYERLRRSGLKPAEQLYRCLLVDVQLVAYGAPELQSVIGLPELRDPRFAPLVKLRERIVKTYERMIAAGIEDGTFRGTPARITAENVTMLTETSLHAPKPDRLGSADKQAEVTADFVLSSLLANPDELPTIAERARECEVDIDLDLISRKLGDTAPQRSPR